MRGVLCNILETGDAEPSIEDIPIVREFPYVFPEEILRMPPLREVEFCIDLAHGARPISRASYYIALVKLKEFKTQLDVLLEKGYIWPSTSPWEPQYCL